MSQYFQQPCPGRGDPVLSDRAGLQADEALRFCLPAVLNPRYTPEGCESINTEAPVALQGPYTLSLGVHVYSPSQIKSIESNCPLTPLEILSQDSTRPR
ncbi:hypothetical protein SKAU_G00090820 [Synaphobranchus kaupii]|uniref:Uncharacterized protein n=1 Tax=Synaphobranchus kaupii TaxID=118154 RepID=A0A9Q1FWC8_SYNKA|nr:hypothetical protein SKAU_G00090820 [Synaphobranchus kaupii]